MHGQLYQLTTRLPLEVVDEIRQWAADLGMTQQDLQRYCFYRGLQALAAGERPEFEEVVVRRKLKPPLSDGAHPHSDGAHPHSDGAPNPEESS